LSDIQVLRISHPPLNVLSVRDGVVATLDAALRAAKQSATVRAVVIAGSGSHFCAGADIADFDEDPQRLNAIRALMNLIESFPKPVVIAIDGLCLGAGLELAAAGHYRIATVGASLGAPEVTLGLLPGAGGTQRIPRLVGAEAAAKLMLDGKAIGATEALDLGLLDAVTSEDVVQAAIAFIEAQPRATRPTSARPVPADMAAALEQARTRSKQTFAQQCILKCLECLNSQSFRDALLAEANYFNQLLASDAARALRHAFFGRRKAARIPGVERSEASPIETVTVVGGGLMGTGIALAVLKAGLKVVVVEPNEGARQRVGAAIPDAIYRELSKKRLSQTQADAQISAFSCSAEVAGGASAQLFIEAVFEDMAVKRRVFEALDTVAAPGAILASNTSTLDLNDIAAVTKRPESVVGLHFFSPANVMRLLEVVRGSRTSAGTLASALAFAKSIGKTAVVAGVCDGFIGNRMFEEYLRQAYFLVEEGALPQQVDQALQGWGMAMGPFRTMDLAGQDIGWNIRARRARTQPERPYSQFLDRIYELGRLGQKTGAGVYRYPDGRTPEIDPQIDELARAESARVGVTRRRIEDGEIIARCIGALISEGARILEEKVAYRPVDIDVVYLDGYGFPAERGGPMYFADRWGLRSLLATLEKYARGRHGWAFEPAPLLRELVARGSTFESLNR
jgi:3-hydroxyacyl-CoA dehydrogenase